MKLPHSIRRPLRHRHIIHKRLQRRLILFPAIALAMFAFVIYDSITDSISPLWILVGALLGLGVGYIVSLIYKIYWREDQQKVVSGFDRMTVLLIILYVLLRIGSERLAGEFIHGSELTIVTFSFLGGLLIGRMIGVLRKINQVLESETVLEHIKNLPRKARRKS